MKLARRLDRLNLRRTALRLKARKDQFRKGLMAERLEDRQLMAGDLLSPFLASSNSAFYNATKPADVTGDGFVAPNDALAIINVLNVRGSHLLSQSGGEGEAGGAKMYIDVNNDGWLAPNDALDVINRLNAEGEPADTDDKMEYILSTTQPFAPGAITSATNPLPAVQVGQAFDLVINVDDLRPLGSKVTPGGQTTARVRGVFAAYTDVLFDQGLAKIAVAERQDLQFGNGTETGTGTFTLTFNGQTTAPIAFDNRNLLGQVTTEAAIQSALDATFGAGAMRVTTIGAGQDENFLPIFSYRVRFTGASLLNNDQPLLTDNNADLNIKEIVAGNSTNFLDAVDFSGPFTAGASGSLQPGVMNGLGATYPRVDDPPIIRPNPQELVRVHLIATLPNGTNTASQTFTPRFTDLVHPAEDSLVMANLDIVGGSQDPLGRESSEVKYETVATPPNTEPIQQIAFNTVTLGITSGPINAQPDAVTTREDTAVTKDVIANDTLNSGASGTISLQSVTPIAASIGTAEKSGNSIVFTPAQDFSGTASVEYIAGISTSSDTAKATLTVTVTPVNDEPVIGPIATQNVDEDAPTTGGTVTVNLTGIAPARATATDELTGGANAQTVSVTAATTSSNPAGLITDLQVNYTTGSTGTLTFKPLANASGTAVITVTVKDNGGTANTGDDDTVTTSFTVNVAAKNDAPENRIGGVAISGANNSVVAPGATFTFTGATQLSVNDVEATGNLTTVLSLPSGQGTLDVIETASGAAVTGDGSNSVTISGTQAAINAALATVIYTPGAGFTATMTMATTDNESLTTTSTINISRDPGVRPFATDNTFTIPEGTTAVQTFDVLADDFKLDAPVQTTIVSKTDPPSGQGTVAIVNNKLEYTPPTNTDFNGTVTFTYTIDDDDAGSNGSLDDRTGTVTVIIQPVNDAPRTVADSYGVQLGQTLTVAAADGVLKNDTDPEGDAMTAINAVIGAGQGTVTLQSTGAFTYTPPSARGSYTFTYVARDAGGAESAPTTVTINVAAAPDTDPDQVTAQEGGGAQSFPTVLSNDNDPEGGTLTASLASAPPAADGTVTMNSNGTFTYTPPNGDFNTTRPARGPVTFTYKAKSSTTSIETTETVSITVQETNDNPTATDDTFLAVKRSGTAPNEIGVDQPVTVLGNDSFAPDVNETLSVSGVSATSGGTFGTGSVNTTGGGSVKVGTVNGVPTILYTSPSTAPVNDSFFYQISDGRGGTATAKVDVSVVDFVPKVISGTVFVDSDNDGVLDAGEKRLSGVDVRLTGTSFDSTTANNVDIVVTTDINGNYAFGAAGSGVTIKPPKDGTSYTLTEISPLYLLNGMDTSNATNVFDHDANPGTPKIAVVNNSNRFDNAMSLRWNVTDDSGNITGLHFGERGVDVASLKDASGFLNEFLASSGSNGMVMTLAGNGLLGEPVWSWNLPGWENAKSVKATLSSDLSSLTLSVVDKTDKPYSVTLYQSPSIPGSMARFRVLGVGSNGQYIIRVDGTAAECGLGLLTAAPSGAGGEGEGSARAYAASADALFAQQAWA